MRMKGSDVARLFGEAVGMDSKEVEDIIKEASEDEVVEEKPSTNKSFHISEDGQPHDTYRNQANYVAGLNNQWATENFNATRPYFA